MWVDWANSLIYFRSKGFWKHKIIGLIIKGANFCVTSTCVDTLTLSPWLASSVSKDNGNTWWFKGQNYLAVNAAD